MTFSISGNGARRYVFTLLCSPTLSPVWLAQWFAVINGEASHPVRFKQSPITQLTGFRWEAHDGTLNN